MTEFKDIDFNEIRNAKVKSTMLGVEDHDIFTFIIDLELSDNLGQSVGTYSLDGWDEKTKKRHSWQSSIPILRKILEICDCTHWEQLPGKYIRIKGNSDRIEEIGNITKNKWLNFKKFFEEYKEWDE